MSLIKNTHIFCSTTFFAEQPKTYKQQKSEIILRKRNDNMLYKIQYEDVRDSDISQKEGRAYEKLI